MKSENRLISEIYRIREYQEKFAQHLRTIMFDLGAWRLGGNARVDMSKWKPKDHYIVLNNHKDSRKRNTVKFFDLRYDSLLSKIEEGTTVTIQDEIVDVNGFSQTFTNKSHTDSHPEKISEEITLSRSVEHEFAQHYEFGVESETKVSGSYAGAELEQTLKVSFGMAFDTTNTESKTKDTTRTIDHSFENPPRTKTVVSFIKNKLVTETPFTVKGYLDSGLELNFEDWSSERRGHGRFLFKGWHKGSKKFKFNNLLDFERFLRGYDVKHLSMQGYFAAASKEAKKAMHWIFNQENRVIDAVGVRRKVFEDNLDVVTDPIPLDLEEHNDGQN